MNFIQEFEHHAARAFFASAWADALEEAGESARISGRDIMDVMPDEIDPAALQAAESLRVDMERANKCGISELLERIRPIADGDRECTAEFFGHYSAMQAMGHGVGLYDAFGSDAYKTVQVPRVEFCQYSLERDYFA